MLQTSFVVQIQSENRNQAQLLALHFGGYMY